jgi:TonB family C-terminal domain
MHASKSFSLAGGGRLAIVAGLHVVLIYLIATSLGIVKAPSFAPPMTATLISEPQSKPEKVDMVKPELEEPTLEIPDPNVIPIPEVEIPTDVASSAAVAGAVSNAIESSELEVSNRVAPNYPAASLAANEEGLVIFRVLVDEQGKPLEINVMKSSGFPRLDNAAAKALRRWVFVPPTQGGQPVRSWSRVQVRFQLNNA